MMAIGCAPWRRLSQILKNVRMSATPAALRDPFEQRLFEARQVSLRMQVQCAANDGFDRREAASGVGQQVQRRAHTVDRADVAEDSCTERNRAAVRESLRQILRLQLGDV